MCANISIALPEAARRAIDLLEEAGFEAWAVGGFVRDSLLERPIHDVDITTSAPWPEAAEVFRAHGFATHETGIAYGTITTVIDGCALEVTTFRSDGAYLDSRHPESVSFVSCVDDDLARRDFTVNAMAYSPRRGLRDPFGGKDDLQARTIRAVGSPIARFNEDALRILRGARFASQLGFGIDPTTRDAMFQAAPLLGGIAVERVRIEVERLLLGESAAQAILACWPVLQEVLPELGPLKDCPQNTPFHIYDVLEHTAHVVQHSPAAPLSRWAALFHDAGKPACRRTDDQGRDHFKGHAAVGARLARQALARLKVPPSLVDDICLLVERHEWYTGADERSVLHVLRHLDGRVDLYRTLLDLQVADSLSKAPGITDRLDAALAARRTLQSVIDRGDPFTLRQLAIGGRELLEAGWPQGPELGAMLETLLNLVIEGELENTPEALLSYASTHRPL